MWRDPKEGDSFEYVAVKCLKGRANEEQRICFLQEAAIMGQFEHSNILRILAIAHSEDMKVTVYNIDCTDCLVHVNIECLHPKICGQYKGGIEDPAGLANAVPLSEAVCNAGPLFDRDHTH